MSVVVFPSCTFSSKKALLDFVRNQILWAYEVDDVVSDPSHFALLVELNDRHPDRDDKVGVGIKEFYVGKPLSDFPISSGSRCLWIRRTDGSVVDWSYRVAVNQPGHVIKVKDALRIAVDKRRLAFRDRAFSRSGGSLPCTFTGKWITSDEADVVYRDPTWGELVGGFVESMGGWSHIAVDVGGGLPLTGARVLDPAVLDAWLAYYDVHAHPLIVAGVRSGPDND